MSGGDVAALIAAGAFGMLVLVLAVPILRLGRTVDAATRAINDLAQRTTPLLGNVNTTVENVNTALTQVQPCVEQHVRLLLSGKESDEQHDARVGR